ncbi:hypothetical protein C7R92_09915 [Brevibacillus porteri]|uniref:Uncharacterized protein n=1 Tax=Brevibacillus porteri TaxID=2126350 RepID=A0ABX5FRR4_9BACL|nr:hypothetical protein C7R92_09915 [Brevibacillus porteri]
MDNCPVPRHRLLFSVETIWGFFVQKKPVEHYYTPLDRVFGQTPVEFHEQKIEKKESEEKEGDDKDKNGKIRQKRRS